MSHSDTAVRRKITRFDLAIALHMFALALSAASAMVTVATGTRSMDLALIIFWQTVGLMGLSVVFLYFIRRDLERHLFLGKVLIVLMVTACLSVPLAS